MRTNVWFLYFYSIKNQSPLYIYHVHSIDRLARSLADLTKLIEELNNKGITVHFHKENLIFKDSNNPIQKLMRQIVL